MSEPARPAGVTPADDESVADEPLANVLVVDDEPEIRRAARMWLTRAGFATSERCDGVEVADAIAEDDPQVIVMDVRMARRDGLTTLAELKRDADTRRIPIVMLSASLVDKKLSLDAGAHFFLTKPYRGAELVEAVRVCLDDAGEASSGPSPGRVPATRTEPHAGPAPAQAPSHRVPPEGTDR